VLVAASNSVNLRTPRWPGNQHVCGSRAAYNGLAYVTGHRVLAEYLLLVRFPQSAELTVFLRALVGACSVPLVQLLPAEIFMGDGRIRWRSARARHPVAILISRNCARIVARVRARSAVGHHQVASFKLTERVFKSRTPSSLRVIGWTSQNDSRFVIVDYFRVAQPDNAEASLTRDRGGMRLRPARTLAQTRHRVGWR